MCGKLEIDYNQVINLSVKDERLGNSHWMVPGPDGDYGFGGHCFPKDLSAIIKMGENLGTTINVLKATKETNDKIRKNKDR